MKKTCRPTKICVTKKGNRRYLNKMTKYTGSPADPLPGCSAAASIASQTPNVAFLGRVNHRAKPFRSSTSETRHAAGGFLSERCKLSTCQVLSACADNRAAPISTVFLHVVQVKKSFLRCKSCQLNGYSDTHSSKEDKVR